MNTHEQFMQFAIDEARKAAQMDEVPIGAVAVYRPRRSGRPTRSVGEVVGRSHNIREATGNPLGHAEILLLEKLTKERGDWRLEDITVYVTCEPCIMCMGALLQARVPRLAFGCFDPKAGACGSLYNLADDNRLNHQIEVTSGILTDECGVLLKEFFKKLR